MKSYKQSSYYIKWVTVMCAPISSNPWISQDYRDGCTLQDFIKCNVWFLDLYIELLMQLRSQPIGQHSNPRYFIPRGTPISSTTILLTAIDSGLYDGTITKISV